MMSDKLFHLIINIRHEIKDRNYHNYYNYPTATKLMHKRNYMNYNNFCQNQDRGGSPFVGISLC